MLNRIAPGVLAVCLAAGLPPGTATPAPVSPNASVSSVNSVQRHDSASVIDLAKAVEAGVSPDVLELALNATSCATTSGAIDAPPTLTLIDYSRPSTEPRLWVFDLATGDLLFKELVAHGRNTGDNLATKFSNNLDSRQTSLGLFVTDDRTSAATGIR